MRGRGPVERAREGGSRAASSELDSAELSGFSRRGARPPVALIGDYVDEHKDDYGVEPICRALNSAQVLIGPSTYNAARTRAPSTRAVNDEGRFMPRIAAGRMGQSEDRSLENGCGFNEFDFFRETDDAYTIDVPKLTLKEMRHLEAQLPGESYADLETVGIPVADAQIYAKVYRYFPKFVDIEA